MSDFITFQQCDEATDYRPTTQDWAEYNAYLETVEAEEQLRDGIITEQEFRNIAW